MKNLKELRGLCEVIGETIQKRNEQADTLQRFGFSLRAIELYREAGDGEKARINELFGQISGKSFEHLSQDFLEGFKGQHRLCELIHRTNKLADEFKSSGWL